MATPLRVQMFKESFTYQDIGLVPKELSDLETRDEASLDMEFCGDKLRLPIISAPMKTVTRGDMAKTLYLSRAAAVVARSNLEDDVDIVSPYRSNSVFLSIGLKDYEEAVDLALVTGIKRFCVDVANGFNKNIANVITYIKSKPNTYVIAGNVASVEGYEYLSRMHVNAVRVGIGNGAMCSTSIATGIGVGQASLIRELADFKTSGRYLSDYPRADIIADGGIKEPGDVCKAIALGADIVMIGTMLAGTDEAPGDIIEHSGRKFKLHAGEASKHTKGNSRYVEGVSTLVPYKGSVRLILKQLEDGLKSSMSYMGCRTLEEFRHLPSDCFVRLSNSARIERQPQI